MILQEVGNKTRCFNSLSVFNKETQGGSFPKNIGQSYHKLVAKNSKRRNQLIS